MSYAFLTRAIKRRLIDDLTSFFAHLPGYQDMAEQVRVKYDWGTPPQRGIVISNVTPTPVRLSADNYLGVQYSYVMKANVDNGAGNASGALWGGLSLDWVKEDTRLVDERYANRFPSPPGIYYLSVHAIPLADPDPEAPVELSYEFYVDPLYQVRQEELMSFVTGAETSATLAHAPLHADSLRLFLAPDIPLLPGQGLRLENTGGIRVLEQTTAEVGLRPGPVPVSLITLNSDPWMIVAGLNDVLSGFVNGVPFFAVLPPGPLTALQLRRVLKDGFALAGVFAPEVEVEVVPGGRVEIRALESLTIDPDFVSTANSVLGLPAGDVAVVLEGDPFQEVVAPGSMLLAIRLNGQDYHMYLPEGPLSREEVLARLQAQTPASANTSWSLVQRGDYYVDPITGIVTFRLLFQPGDVVYADYRYPGTSSGPYPMRRYQANHTAIPGAVLAWGGLFPDQPSADPRDTPVDKMAVYVHERRQAVADTYGGKFTLSVELEVITRDAQAREELSDLLMLQFHHWEHERLATDGILITNISSGGESEESYDDVGDDYFFRTSVSLEFLVDWQEDVPRPLFIERIVPVSYASEAASLGPDGDPLDEGDIRPGLGFNRNSPEDSDRQAREANYEGVR